MNKFILAILFTLLLIGYIILDLLLNDQMWNVSKSFAISLQKSIPLFEQIVYEFFTYVVFIPPLAALYCFIFTDNKLNSLLYLTVTVCSVTANELLKNLYHQARPYMIESEIQSLKCNSDYGKPSGHSQNSVVMLLLLPFLLFPQLMQLKKNRVHVEMPIQHTGYTITSYDLDKNVKVNVEEQSTLNIVLKIVLLLFFLSSIIMTGISRIFLGVHSLGQVILGWVYGLYIVFMYIYVIHETFRKSVFEIMNKNMYMGHFIPMSFLMLIVILGISLGLLKINYLVYYDDYDMEKWIERINECKHSDFVKSSPKILFNSCFLVTPICSLITGLIVGGVLIQGNYEEGYYNRYKIPIKYMFYRIGLLFAPFLILIPFLFINFDNVVLQTLTQIVPLSFGVGFIINFIYPYLLRQFNLQVRGDLFYIKQTNRIMRSSAEQQLKQYGDDAYLNTF